MEKQYIECILKNEAHLNRIKELQKLWDEYLDCMMDGIETNIDGVFVPNSKIHDAEYIENEFKKLVEDNYFFDHDCDPYLVIEEGYTSALSSNYLFPFINTIEEEQKRRHTRKRHPKKSWERLKVLGLEK
jgi:hypothetical protein